MTWNDVTKYIRNRLSLPSGFIEKTEEELIEYFKENTLRDFSLYFPDMGRCIIFTNNPNFRHPERKNWFYIFDDLNLDIFGIKNCYFNLEKELLAGHPIMPPLSFSGLEWWALDVFKYGLLKQFSPYNYTYKFYPPNIIEIIGMEEMFSNIGNKFLVEYERLQPTDLSNIRPSLYQKFKELCLADAMIWIGQLRSLYGDGRLNSPFSDIPLNGSELISRGEDKRERLLSEFSDEQRPPIIIDVY